MNKKNLCVAQSLAWPLKNQTKVCTTSFLGSRYSNSTYLLLYCINTSYFLGGCTVNIIALVVILLSLCPPSHGQVAQGALLGPEDTVRVERCKLEYQLICREVGRIAKENGVEARLLYDQLHYNADLILAHPSGTLLLLRSEKRPAFQLQILLTDANEAMGKNSLVETTMQYDFNQRIITVQNSRTFSLPWLAYGILHELFHYQHWTGNTNRWKIAEHERDAYEFQLGLIRQDGGARYTAAVKREVERVNTIALGGKSLASTCPTTIKGIMELDNVPKFGKAKSNAEYRYRLMHVWVDAAFTMIDAQYKESADRQFRKASFVYDFTNANKAP